MHGFKFRGYLLFEWQYILIYDKIETFCNSLIWFKVIALFPTAPSELHSAGSEGAVLLENLIYYSQWCPGYNWNAVSWQHWLCRLWRTLVPVEYTEHVKQPDARNSLSNSHGTFSIALYNCILNYHSENTNPPVTDDTTGCQPPVFSRTFFV